MPMILVADDSELDRAVIADILQKEPLDWLVEMVSSAEEAMALMKEVAFDVVITDVLMAGLSGLDLLNHVHRQPRRVPVVVISGESEPETAIAALRQGAANYVPKSEMAARLGETVRQLLELTSSQNDFGDLIQCADEMRFQFTLQNNPQLIPSLIHLLQQLTGQMGVLSDDARTRLGVAVDEALVNAMCHGNLQLSEDDMTQVRANLHAGVTIQPIRDRCTESPYCNRQVHVALGMSKEGVKIVVRDEGQGFSPSTQAFSNEHRGLTLIQNLVDRATFNETGNEITLIKLRDQEPEQPRTGDRKSA